MHPLCSLFPRMTGYEFECLKLDIKENGLRTPITMHHNMILDGGNRYKACVELGINPIYEDFVGDAIGAFVLTSNLHRRHLSTTQSAAIVASVQDWGKAQSVGKPKCATRSTLADTVKSRSESSGASIATQRKADAVAKANPELAAKVARGEVSLNDATREVAPQLAPKKIIHISEINDEDDGKNIWIESLKAQEEQITALKDRQAVSIMDIPANERIDVLEEMKSLRTQLKTAQAIIDSITISRDAFQRENAQLKKQIAMLEKKAKK